MAQNTQPDSNQSRSTDKHFQAFSFGLTHHQLERLGVLAKQEGTSRSELGRHAIEVYLSNYDLLKTNEREARLEKRMRIMEDALRGMMAKTIRLEGQILYFVTLPFLEGLPQRRLSQKGFDLYYKKSLDFAAVLLKSKKLPESDQHQGNGVEG